MRAQRSPLAVVLAVAVATAPLLSQAQTSPPTPPTTSPSTSSSSSVEEAAQRYKRGTELYGEGDFDGALVEFKKAYELTHSYKVLYNIGQVCYQLQDYVCALESFEEYAQKGASELPQKRKDEVAAEIAKLKPRIAMVTITTNVEGVDITIDDKPRGRTPLSGPVALSGGSHRLNATKSGKLPITQIVDVAGNTTPTIALELVDAGGKEVIVEREVGSRSKFTTLSFIGLGIGGALAIGAGVTGVLALNASSSLKSMNYYGDPSAEAKSQQSKVKTLRLTTDILATAAVLTLGVTIIATVLRHPETKTDTADNKKKDGVDLHVLVGLTGASIQGEF